MFNRESRLWTANRRKRSMAQDRTKIRALSRGCIVYEVLISGSVQMQSIKSIASGHALEMKARLEHLQAL